MTINVNPERSTLSLPGLRLRPEGALGRVGAEPGPERGPGRAADISISREQPGLGALRGLALGLDRASSVGDVAVAATDAIVGLLTELRDLASDARSPGTARGEAFSALIEQVGDLVKAASFGGVNLLDGSLAGGALRVPVSAGDLSEVSLTARDMRPGGPVVGVTADLDPATALPAVEESLGKAETAGRELRDEFKRLDTHRSFLSALSDAVTGGEPANLDVEGARLAALSVKQALEGRTVSVSNAAPQAVLSLFR